MNGMNAGDIFVAFALVFIVAGLVEWLSTPREKAAPQECHSCRFWSHPQKRQERNAYWQFAGSCQRRAPVVETASNRGQYMPYQSRIFPTTNHDDYCGDWRADARG